MKVLNSGNEGQFIIECSREDIKIICYVLEFAHGGVGDDDVETKMLKIVGALESAIEGE